MNTDQTQMVQNENAATGRCWLFHTWSKWKARQVMLAHFSGHVKLGEGVEHRQSRCCLKCGLVEERIIS